MRKVTVEAKQSVKGSAEGVHIKPRDRNVKIRRRIHKFIKVHVHACHITQIYLVSE